jgi:Domain of unknown function (DUF1905)
MESPKQSKPKKFRIRARVWLYPGESGQWHFITIPKAETLRIHAQYGSRKRGWGSLPVDVTIGTVNWRTSIFPETKSGTFLLPIKASVRKQTGVCAEDLVTVLIQVCP